MQESQVDKKLGEKIVKFGRMTRNLKGSGLDEGASTRLLVNAGKLIQDGIKPVVATDTASPCSYGRSGYVTSSPRVKSFNFLNTKKIITTIVSKK